MVQGLAFLSKKSWHVKNIANQERVWVEEQKKAAEELKTKELAKQIQQELEEEELDRIAGRKKSDRLDRGIDWMYQGVKSEACQEDAKKEAEEYLLGKKFTGAVEHKGDLAQDEADDKQGINAVISTVEEKADPYVTTFDAGPTVKDKNEAFRVRHEDPMFLVARKHREEDEKIEKKKALYERVVGPVDDEHHESGDKKEKRRKRKKEEKRKRKEQRREERRRRRQQRRPSPSESEESDYGSGADYRRHKSYAKRQRTSSPPRKFDRDYRSNRYDDRYYSSDEDSYHRRSESNRRDRERRSYRDYSPDERRRRCGEADEDSKHRSRPEFDRDHSPDERHRHRGESNEDSKHHSRPEYGLLGSEKKQISTKDLGPGSELLEEKRKKMEARRRLHESSSRRKKMTAEERERALLEMQSKASRQTAPRGVAPQAPKEEERKSAAFLHKISQETHGIRGKDHANMALRITQNRNRNQKSIDDSFL